MYYIIQERLYREDEWDDLIKALERLNLEYEIVKLIPFIDDFEFKTERKDVFCFGALKMARLTPKYGWKPGCIMTSNHDFNVYKEYYKENLLNYDSKIFKIGDDFTWNGDFFVRPVLDTKIFNGRPYKKEDWDKEKERLLNNSRKDKESGITNIVSEDTLIQVSSLKNIQKEFRFYIVDGEIITGSLYKEGYFVRYSDIVDDEAIDFCNDMIKRFELAEAFVMDVCLTDNQWKIIECGCINCAGLYKANIPKLLMAIEDKFNQ
jgi:hypothetical protein